MSIKRNNAKPMKRRAFCLWPAFVWLNFCYMKCKTHWFFQRNGVGRGRQHYRFGINYRKTRVQELMWAKESCESINENIFSFLWKGRTAFKSHRDLIWQLLTPMTPYVLQTSGLFMSILGWMNCSLGPYYKWSGETTCDNLLWINEKVTYEEV